MQLVELTRVSHEDAEHLEDEAQSMDVVVSDNPSDDFSKYLMPSNTVNTPHVQYSALATPLPNTGNLEY